MFVLYSGTNSRLLRCHVGGEWTGRKEKFGRVRSLASTTRSDAPESLSSRSTTLFRLLLFTYLAFGAAVSVS